MGQSEFSHQPVSTVVAFVHGQKGTANLLGKSAFIIRHSHCPRWAVPSALWSRFFGPLSRHAYTYAPAKLHVQLCDLPEKAAVRVVLRGPLLASTLDTYLVSHGV